jgi:hypothetical protein
MPTTGCSLQVAKPLTGETEVLVVSKEIDVSNMSFSMYPDVGWPSVVAVSSLATAIPCLVVASFTKESAFIWETYNGSAINKKSLLRLWLTLVVEATREKRDQW